MSVCVCVMLLPVFFFQIKKKDIEYKLIYSNKHNNMFMNTCIYVYFVFDEFGVAGGFCCSPFDRSDIWPLLGVGGG